MLLVQLVLSFPCVPAIMSGHEIAVILNVAGLSEIADVPGVNNGVVGVFAVPFEHAVGGRPAVTGFLLFTAFLLLLAPLLILVSLF